MQDTAGLYEKFTVRKNEGKPPFMGEHFVLFPRRDPWASAALWAYQDAARLAGATDLANDIANWLEGIRAEQTAEAQEAY